MREDQSTIVEMDKGGGLQPEPPSMRSTSKRSQGMNIEDFHDRDDAYSSINAKDDNLTV